MGKASKKTIKVKDLSNDLLKDLNKKVSSTKKELQKQVDELTAQVNELKSEATKPAEKWLKKVEKQYQKQLSKQQKELKKEFEEKTEALLDVKDKLVTQLREEVLSKIPFAEKLAPAPKTPAQKAKATVKKAATTAKAKASSAKAAATSSAKSGISSIRGIGPATLKKLNEAGFTSLEDLANTPADKLAALEPFKKVRGFDSWAEQAKDLLKK